MAGIHINYNSNWEDTSSNKDASDSKYGINNMAGQQIAWFWSNDLRTFRKSVERTVALNKDNQRVSNPRT